MFFPFYGEKKRLVDLFNFKKQQNGCIDKDDLIGILKSLGFKINDTIFEVNKDNYHFEELEDYVNKFHNRYYEKKKIEECLKYVNPNPETEDFIDKQTLKKILCENGNMYSDKEFENFLLNIPVDPKGNITHSDLIEILSKYVDNY